MHLKNHKNNIYAIVISERTVMETHHMRLHGVKNESPHLVDGAIGFCYLHIYSRGPVAAADLEAALFPSAFSHCRPMMSTDLQHAPHSASANLFGSLPFGLSRPQDLCCWGSDRAYFVLG